MKTIKTRGFGILLLMATSLSLSTLLNYPGFAQEVKKAKPNKPDVKIDVKKEYDDKGNVTRYDSTYSYSWSGNGTFPPDIDSVIRSLKQKSPFNFDFNFDINGFGWPFSSDSTLNEFFNFSDKNLKPHFDWSPWLNDSLLNKGDDFFFGDDIREMMKHHQEMMDRLMKRFYPFDDLENAPPSDTIPGKSKELKKVLPQKQNYHPRQQPSGSILI